MTTYTPRQRVRQVLVWLMEAAVLLYFAIGKPDFESRLRLGPISLNEFLQVAVLAALVLVAWNKRADATIRYRSLGLLAALTGLLWIGAAFGQNSAYVLVKPLGYAGVVLPCLILAATHLRTEADVRRILLYWCALGSAMMLAGLLLLLRHDAPARLAVMGGGANVYARMVASALLIGIGLRPSILGSRLRALAMVATVGFGVALVCAGSKAAILSFGCALIALGWFRRQRGMLVLAVVGTLAFACSPLVIHALVANANKDRGSVRLFRMPDTADPRGSYGTRLQYFQASMRVLPAHLLTGVGTGDWGPAVHLPSGRRYPHNVFLELACELGIAGLATLLVYLLLGWRASAALRRHGGEARLPGTLLALLVFWFLNAQNSGDVLDNRHMWWPLLLLEIVYMQRCRRQARMETATPLLLPSKYAARMAP
jgi:hypothetical protein